MKIKRKKYSGKIRNASKIIYDNIEFKSKLELYCYSKLKENSILSEYEKHTFELIPSFKSTTSFEPGKEKGISIIKEKNNSIRRMTYTPDFVNIKDKWIIECKG